MAPNIADLVEPAHPTVRWAHEQTKSRPADDSRTNNSAAVAG
ncbi:MAG: hypothetical protein WAX14_16780 [Rhodococcus sp. (in: high G+C Gram-positive bacteria)]